MPSAASFDTVKQIFDKIFSAWEIVLPTEGLNEQRRGSIVKNGWTINYQYGSTEGVEYLEYFASHRMTNDSLNRIYADGREELLGYCQVFYTADNEQAERDYFEHNRQFYEEVKRKGLW